MEDISSTDDDSLSLSSVVNVGILGTVGYFSYKNWNLPKWDRKTVSSVVVGLIALSAAEG